jgi:hypothetical protein
MPFILMTVGELSSIIAASAALLQPRCATPAPAACCVAKHVVRVSNQKATNTRSNTTHTPSAQRKEYVSRVCKRPNVAGFFPDHQATKPPQYVRGG